MWSVKELLSGFKTKHFGVSFHMAELVQPQYDEVTVVILRIWGSDWAFFWASRTPPHRGITQYWVLTYNVAKLYQKYLISGNPATLSIILFFCSLPLLFQRWMNVHKIRLQLWCSKSVWGILRIIRFISLQIFRVSPFQLREEYRLGFPLLLLCSTAVGLEAGKAVFFCAGSII